MDNRPNTESGQPKRTTAMGTMTMAPRAAAPGMGSGISLPPLMEVLGDYYRSPHNDSSRFNMPRRFAERESPIISLRTTPPLPTITSIASVLDPTSSSPKRRKLVNSPPRRPITLARPTSSKRTATEAFEREGTQPTVPYTGYTPVYPPAEIERRRHSNISSTSHPETSSLPPVSAITTSRGSSSESERHAVPLPSLFSHNTPPTPHTSGRGYPYDPDYPAQYNPPTYYRHSGEQHQPYLPPSPTPHSHYSSHSHSPPHHAPLLTQPYTATSRTGMYRPSQATSTQDRTPFSHGSLDSYDQVARLGVKRRRGNLPKQVTDTLRSWLTNHVAHPYPTEEEKQQLCQITGLNMNQISNWFINARRRKLPQQRNDTEPPHLLAQARNTTPPRPSPSLGHTRSHSHDNILPPPLPSQPQGPYPPSGR